MKLNGSCHCGKVRFTLNAQSPVPYNLCYCSICRKTAGSGGFAINLGADADSLSITGKEHISRFNAIRRDDDGHEEVSEAERSFCKHCGTALWVYSPSNPDLIHPQAGCIDTPLPKPPMRVHNMINSKPEWVGVCTFEDDEVYDEFGPESLKSWHEKHGLYDGS